MTSCYSLLEASWSTRSDNYKFLSEPKLRHALSSCKTFFNLSIAKELSEEQREAQFWFHLNLGTSILSTVMFFVITLTLSRLRRSTRLRNRMKRYMPASWTEREQTEATAWYKITSTMRKRRSRLSSSYPKAPVPTAQDFYQHSHEPSVQANQDYPKPDPFHSPMDTKETAITPGAPACPYPMTGLVPIPRTNHTFPVSRTQAAQAEEMARLEER